MIYIPLIVILHKKPLSRALETRGLDLGKIKSTLPYDMLLVAKELKSEPFKSLEDILIIM